ncbi:unnamed protein product [Onchocerca flexuosa]|uniref:BZIP domain-containing protein n=1 Tax=Onchocerca flexuosa TaxID=387005 RepID=A0A183H5J7_9BILA|nr:unnamed protein product [Onchocerca flexuosa]
MDGMGIESCSSSHPSSSLRGLNLISSSDHIERRPSDSSNSSEASISPVPSNTDPNRPIVNESSRDDVYWEKQRHNDDVAKKSRGKRHMNDMIMEQKLLELTRENNLLRNRLKQQQQQQKQRQQQKQQQQQQQQEQQALRSVSHDTVIVSTVQSKDTVDPVIPTVSSIPSLPVSSVTTLAANLANVIGPPSKLPALFPTHLFAAAPLLATSSTSAPSPIFIPSGTKSPTSLLTPAENTAAQMTASATQQFPALQICTLQAALQQVQNYCPSSGPPIISSGHGAFQPFHSSRDPTSSTQIYSPDSSTTDTIPMNYLTHGTIGTIHTETSSGPSNILRYQLPERQPDLSRETGMKQQVSSNVLAQPSFSLEKAKKSNPDDMSRSLLGLLLSTKRTSPLVPQSRTDTHSGLNNTTPKDVN